MVKKIIKIFIILALLTYSAVSCDRMQPDDIDVSGTVYARYQNQGRYGSTFIMVVRMDDGHLFDLEVTPSTFASCKEGSRVSFKDVSEDTVYPDKDFHIGFWAISGGIAELILGLWLFSPIIIKDWENSK